jgi:hypothetical protein
MLTMTPGLYAILLGILPVAASLLFVGTPDIGRIQYAVGFLIVTFATIVLLAALFGLLFTPDPSYRTGIVLLLVFYISLAAFGLWVRSQSIAFKEEERKQGYRYV